MAEEIQISGKTYISSKRAAEILGYAQDYIGQLARGGYVDAQRVGGLWYVNTDSILEHKKKADEYVPQPPQRHIPKELESIISLDGKEHISAARASEITGYHRDYVGQLARAKLVSSQQVGNRWYVDRKELVAHKAEKDALLAAVQSEAVGLRKSPETAPEAREARDGGQTYFRYTSHEGKALLQNLLERQKPVYEVGEAQEKEDVEHKIPIYVKAMPVQNYPTVTPYKNLNVQTRRNVRSYGTNLPGGLTALTIFAAIIFGAGAYLFFGTTSISIANFLSNGNNIVKESDGILFSTFSNVASAISGFAELMEQYLIPELEYRSR